LDISSGGAKTAPFIEGALKRRRIYSGGPHESNGARVDEGARRGRGRVSRSPSPVRPASV